MATKVNVYMIESDLIHSLIPPFSASESVAPSAQLLPTSYLAQCWPVQYAV